MDNSSGGENNIWLFLSLIIIGGGLVYGLTGGDKREQVKPVNTSAQQENIRTEPVNSAAEPQQATTTKEIKEEN